VRPDTVGTTAGLTAYPGPPRIKLSPKIAGALVAGQCRGIHLNRFAPKLVVPLDAHQVHEAPAPFAAVYLLTPPGKRAPTHRVTIRRVSQRRGFVELLRNTFNAQVRDCDRLQRQFRQAARIVATVPVKSLSYRRHTSMLPIVRDAILADLDR